MKLFKLMPVALLIFLTVAGSASAEATSDVGQDEINIYVDGERVEFEDQQPYVDENNRTMVPVRFPAQELGADVDWKGSKQKVLVEHDKRDKEIKIWIDQREYEVNNKMKEMDTEAVITGGRTMVPLRFISEALGASVDWDGDTNTVTIENTSEHETKDPESSGQPQEEQDTQQKDEEPYEDAESYKDLDYKTDLITDSHRSTFNFEESAWGGDVTRRTTMDLQIHGDHAPAPKEDLLYDLEKYLRYMYPELSEATIQDIIDFGRNRVPLDKNGPGTGDRMEIDENGIMGSVATSSNFQNDFQMRIMQNNRE